MRDIVFDMTEPHRGLDKKTLDSYGVGFKDGFIVFQYREQAAVSSALKRSGRWRQVKTASE